MHASRISGLALTAVAVIFTSSVFATATQEEAAEKAAFALNTSAEQVKVTDVKTSGIKVTYKAQYAGGVYNCYYISADMTSDALCSGPINNATAPKPHSGAGCNALLKAAGRCE